MRKAIGPSKKKAEAEYEAIRTDIRGGHHKEPRRDSFDVLVEQYEALKKDKKDTPQRRRTLSGWASVLAGINHYLNCLRAMLNKADKWEWIEKNPALGGKVEREPVSPGRNEYHTPEQAGKLLDVCHPHLRPIVLCALESGMRKSEILGASDGSAEGASFRY